MNWTGVGIGCVKAAFEALREIKEVKTLNKEVNIQTNADIASHKAIVNYLKDNAIQCDVYSEEENRVIKINGGNARIIFIIDPLDNTLFFLRGELSFCSIALMIIINGVPEYSFIGGISNSNIYHCDKKYAYKNNRKIRISGTVQGRKIILGWAPYKMRIRRFFDNLIGLSEEKYYLYNFGGQLQAVKIVEGSYDAYLEVRSEALNEFCAALIVERAGGIISTLRDKKIEWNPTKKQTLIIARDRETHKEILDRFKENNYED